MPDQNYLKPRLCLHYSAYYRVFNIFSPFVSPAIHIKTLLLLVVLCEKSRELTNRRLFEFTIHSKDDDVGARATNFHAVSEAEIVFFFSFLFTSRIQFKPKCLTSDKRELVLHTLIETAL